MHDIKSNVGSIYISVIEDGYIVYRDYVDISVAVATPKVTHLIISICVVLLLRDPQLRLRRNKF